MEYSFKNFSLLPEAAALCPAPRIVLLSEVIETEVKLTDLEYQLCFESSLL
jgi:hypothetical protein